MCQILIRLSSSWGCVQALILTLTILIFPITVNAFLPTTFDLLEALELPKNHSRYLGVSEAKGMEKPAVKLGNQDMRNLSMPTPALNRAINLIKSSPDFTFSTTVRQEKQSVGTLISFSSGNNRYLELESSGRRNEIRFIYTVMGAENTGYQKTESFSYTLADYKWHKVSLTVSGSEIQLLVDCHLIYRRMADHIPDRNFSASEMHLFVGQRDADKDYQLKGYIQDAYIVSGPNGYLKQCPNMATQCPTCGQFSLLEKTIDDLIKNLDELKQRLVAQEDRIVSLEKCDCKKSCVTLDGKKKEDNERWDDGCNTCICEKGEIKCNPKSCIKPKCKNPEFPPDDKCCPRCLKNCLENHRIIEHGEFSITGCVNCTCTDGILGCAQIICPILSCPPETQVQETNQCCKFCPGDDYCGKGHACHINATCLNLNTKYSCTCRPGFQGNGFDCIDIDECAQQGGQFGNHCHLNTVCENTIGSYVCNCLPGFRRVDKFNCAEINECASNQHSCHENAVCLNTVGSYNCRCKEGYQGDGLQCRPVCKQKCLNGGVCTAPNTCTCRMGYIGPSCERDLDECATGLHTCKSSAYCVNMPGWYYCKCKPGYETHNYECHDINECYHGTHSCHPTALCVNYDGHFECICPDNSTGVSKTDVEPCRLSCMFEDMEIPDGERVSPRNQPCKICTCNKGVISCEEPVCNCSTWKKGNGRDLCCPQCDPRESCLHQELKHIVFRSGEQWIYQCQTCECLYGEFDCWKLECPPLTCDKPLPLAPGDCCPRCEDDPCNILVGSNSTGIYAAGKPCTYKGHEYESGQQFSDLSSHCTTCACKVPYCAQLVSNSACCVHRKKYANKDGQLCCSFDNSCNDALPNTRYAKTNHFVHNGKTLRTDTFSTRNMATTGVYHYNSFVPSTNILSPASIHRRNRGRSKAFLNQRTMFIEKLIDTTVTTYSNDERSSYSDESDRDLQSLPHTTSIAPAA
ncbi:protein kinase C-binding protein NELL1-like isoform X2 [Contarinia nasturtii]|uniref:protein kinase C-binding protein NELL1-like isoform X2 n=1 Tax=Contarinia nasturtii TaxID=265458 RepID=UPI0012D42983|nr:protein kinase C-binding protein NELL1-like isoform X2 [Contarinia nasturtii]